MSAELAAAALLAVAATASGGVVLRSGRSRTAGLALLLGGTVTVLASAAAVLGVDGPAPPAYRLAGCLLLPLAVLTYPRAAWRDPLSFVLAVLVTAAGVLAVTWPDTVEPMGYVIVLALLVHVWWAFERGDAEDRRALTWSSLAWVGSGLVAGFLGFLSESAGTGGVPDLGAVYLACLSVGPVAMAVGAVRPEVVDARGLVTRAVVDATVLVSYAAVAIGLTAAAELVGGPLPGPTPVVVLCAVLAFGVQPLRVLLRGVVDQLLFGDRPDPLVAATSLADQIGDDPSRALDAIREALVLPYAVLRAGGAVLATSGTEVTHTRVLPLVLGRDEIGEVEVGLRAGDLGLAAPDADVLRIVAPLLAQTLRARAMSRDLRRSREAVVTAVEEERRRLRDDLHDGLGPTLSGVALATDAARNQLRSHPDKADELLRLLRAETTGAIAEIRRLVEGLRPPALDELGLVGAVRQHAVTLNVASGTLLDTRVEVPDRLPPLPAASEVAAYRIVVEALTNVARHADAATACVEIAVRGTDLQVSVRDDGGSDAPWTAGVGISSMRQRAQAVGGSLWAGATGGGGLVDVRIPLGHPDSSVAGATRSADGESCRGDG